MDKLEDVSDSLESTNGQQPLTGEETKKREFVRPEVSVPVDVLEATTFFQFADSGQTNP